MGIFSSKKALGASAVVALIGGLVLGAAPAQASNRPIDVTGYSVANLVISNDSCKPVLVKAKAKFQKDFNFGDAQAVIARKGDDVANPSFYFDNKKMTSASDRVDICPRDYGLGVYTVGPAEIWAQYLYKENGDTLSNSRSYWDTTKKSFNVRGKTKSTLTAKRSGKKVTLTAKASFFSPEKDRYAQYNPKNAKLQVKSGKTWKTIKTLKLNKGKAAVTLKDSKKKTYRVTVPTASWAVATTTKAVTK